MTVRPTYVLQKLSVPSLPSSRLHTPVQVSRSVPCPPVRPPKQPHRKLTRVGLAPSQQSGKYRRERVDHHGGKRRKQDVER